MLHKSVSDTLTCSNIHTKINKKWALLLNRFTMNLLLSCPRFEAVNMYDILYSIAFILTNLVKIAF